MVSAPVRIAAAWSWRVILVVAAIGLVGWLLSKVSTVLIPVAIAALLAGLLTPAVKWLRSKRVPGAWLRPSWRSVSSFWCWGC